MKDWRAENLVDDVQPMYVRLPVDLHSAVKARAALEDRTMAQLIRVALRFYLANTEPVAPPPGSSYPFSLRKGLF